MYIVQKVLTIEVFLKLKHISASSLKDFIRCNRMLYYRKFFAETANSTDEQGAGSAVHKIVEEKWDKRDPEYEKLIRVQYNVGEDMNSRMIRSISNFYSQYSSLLTKDDLSEYNFKIQLSKEVALVGKMDRVITSQDIIIDWKTSEFVPKSIDNDVQFIIYYIAYKEIFGREPTVMLINLARNKVVEFKPKKWYVDPLRNEILPYMARMVERNEYPRTGLFNGNCVNCSYIDTCWKEIT